MQKIETLDTTLRDGAQSEGVVFSLEDKIKIVRALDELGVDFIEAGNPGSNPKDRDLIRWYASRPDALQNARICAFCMTARPGTDPADSPSLASVIESGAKAASVVGKASARQAEEETERRPPALPEPSPYPRSPASALCIPPSPALRLQTLCPPPAQCRPSVPFQSPAPSARPANLCAQANRTASAS